MYDAISSIANRRKRAQKEDGGIVRKKPDIYGYENRKLTMRFLCLDCDYITVGLPKCGNCLSDNTQQVSAIHPTKKCKCGCGNNVNFNEKKGQYSEYLMGHNKGRLGTGESITNEKGYRKIRVDGKYQFEHRMVMEVFLGRKLTQDEQVHHVNGNRLDNRIENLQLFPNATAHSKLCYEVHQNHKTL